MASHPSGDARLVKVREGDALAGIAAINERAKPLISAKRIKNELLMFIDFLTPT
jgi:hypothetical protein